METPGEQVLSMSMADVIRNSDALDDQLVPFTFRGEPVSPATLVALVHDDLVALMEDGQTPPSISSLLEAGMRNWLNLRIDTAKEVLNVWRL